MSNPGDGEKSESKAENPVGPSQDHHSGRRDVG
jgi:hypothetical protein